MTVLQPVCECVALYDYKSPSGSSSDQLELKKGDRVRVFAREESGWWSGMRISDSASGWFPGSFVEVVVEQVPVPNIVGSPSAVRGISELKDQKVEDDDWAKHYTENGDLYYVNSRTGQSSWSLPSKNNNPSSSSAINSNNSKSSFFVNRQASNSVSGKSMRSIVSDEGWDSVPIIANEDQQQLSAGLAQSLQISSPVAASVASTSSKILSGRKSSAALSTSSASIGKSGGASPSPDMSFQDPSPVSVATDGKYKYIDNFWSDKGGKTGFEVLVLKHRNGKEVCKEVSAFMLERSRIEEVYAKSLMELATSTLGDLESGTAKTAWNQLKFDLKTQAKARLDFSAKLMTDVHQPTMLFKNEQKKMRKNYEATIANDRKSMMVKFTNVQKMRKVYYQRAREAEAADSLLQAFSQSPASNAANRKDYLKAEETARRERKKASMAEYDYRTAVEDFEKVRGRWEEDMQSAFHEFQSAEEERLEFLGHILKSYLAVQKEVNEYCKGSSEMVDNSIQSISKDVDIEMFVKQYFTGGHRPAPLQFEPYQPRH